MAFVPTGPTREAISWNELFGSAEKNSAALKGAKAFRDAAKAGKFAVDPDQAEKALKELDAAGESMHVSGLDYRTLAQAPPIGSSPFASSGASPSYMKAGSSAVDAIEATRKVLSYYREGVEAAMNNYRRLDDGAASSFRGKA
jgi:hypothetical protein